MGNGRVESEPREELLAHAIDGRFASWKGPSRADVQAMAERLARRVVGDRG